MTKKKGNQFEVPAGAVYALLAATSLICITILAVALAGDDGTPEEKIEVPMEKLSHLTIEDVYFRSYESATVSLLVTIYVTNDGTMDASNVQAHIWPVVEGSNIATDTEEIIFGDISVNETKVGEIPINLKAGTLHSVEILLFDSGKLVLKGRASISTDGQPGAQYNNEEVRGTTSDSDYDGIPDTWDEHFGLDPNDPGDAKYDSDGDGFTNLDEYKLGRDPLKRPGEADPNDDNGPITAMTNIADGEDSTIAIGAGLFLVLIIGVIVVLIAGAVVSHRRREKGKEEEFYNPSRTSETSSGGQVPPERMARPEFQVEVREGHHDEDIESDVPLGRGIYE